MRKVIFAVNITITGSADHTDVIADDELHDFYTDLLNDVDLVLFGRKTYQLLESFWPNAQTDARSTKSMLRFADKINSLHKIVLSKTLTKVCWNNSEVLKGNLREKILALKRQKGKNISIGGLSVATELTKLGLIDDYWFLVQPIFSVYNKQIFDGLNKVAKLKLVDTKTFNSGVVVLHYQNLPRENV